TLNAGFRDYDFNHSDYGELESRSWFAGADMAWQLHERVSLSHWYTYDWSRSIMRSRDRAPGQPDTPAFDWRSRIGDNAQTGGVALDFAILPGKLNGQLSYQVIRGIAETDASGDGGAAVDWPNIDEMRQVVRAFFDYRINEALSVNFQYRFEKGDLNQFQTDDLGLLVPGRTDLYLNQALDDYRAHIFEWGLTFYFGGAERSGFGLKGF
ncbi:MAG: MtrB/PioB family outer membrane beta-barrel protein, partial [Gammaproteobacteria bacterium]|nr:MtrB/PioB family outer membrane beta-barrel protein [Gammaproteobacteria bacterium]